jgi:DNA (cytosine-5)-methyltransferase 1
MRIGSLFSGYGGADLAVQSVWPDAHPAWFVEFDKHPSTVLATHWPDVPNYGDVTAVDWAAVEPVDILTGGFPCQDLSHAGKRAGLRPGTRSGLWEHMAYAIDQLRPALVLIENVRGLLSAEAHSNLERDCWCVGDEREPALRALGSVLGDLADLGYDARWTSVRAADVGAPHGRFRVFILAYPHCECGRKTGGGNLQTVITENADLATGDQRRQSTPGQAEVGRARADAGRSGGARTMTDELLPTPTVQDGANAGGPSQAARNTPPLNSVAVRLMPTPKASDGPNGGPGMRNGRGDADALPGSVHLLPTPAVNDMGDGKTPPQWDEWTARMRTKHGNGNGHGKSLAVEAQRLIGTPTAGLGSGGGRRSHTFAPDSGSEREPNPRELIDVLPTPRATRGGSATETVRKLPFTDFGPYTPAIRRWEHVLGRPAPSPTEPGREGKPRLSSAFVEWMMGLPEGWVTDTDIPRSAQLKALGNGIMPQQAALAIRLLLERDA